jgi:UDP-galactopyranose mutase
LPSERRAEQSNQQIRALLDDFVSERVARRFIAWYYTPMALAYSRHLKPAAVVYDCMDELSNFKAAPPELGMLEGELFRHADIIFTGGYSLYEHKRDKHPNVHPFPSSVDCKHFRSARIGCSDPEDQRSLPRPRIGYTGVIDERFDVDLVRAVAAARPEWQFVMVGPIVKIDPAMLPRGPNLHYLGSKPYTELPAYLAGWDVAIMPFARNEATRFISPTKTPEYLAAGRRVVSTSIRDVVRSYGDAGLAFIADDEKTCIAALETALREPCCDPSWLAKVDAYLDRMSWDQTFHGMWRLVEKVMAQRASSTLARSGRMLAPAPLSAGASPASATASASAPLSAGATPASASASATTAG